jgi:hypothetical protein
LRCALERLSGLVGVGACRPAAQGTPDLIEPARWRKRTASGQALARAMRTRLAVSVTRVATLRSRSLIVPGCQVSFPSRSPSARAAFALLEMAKVRFGFYTRSAVKYPGVVVVSQFEILLAAPEQFSWRSVRAMGLRVQYGAAMLHTAKILATGKGFALCDARSAGQYHLFDSLTGLPAVNLRQGKIWFTLQEVVEFLDSLVNRPLSSEA